MKPFSVTTLIILCFHKSLPLQAQPGDFFHAQQEFPKYPETKTIKLMAFLVTILMLLFLFFFINLLLLCKKKGKKKLEIGISCFGDKFPVVLLHVTAKENLKVFLFIVMYRQLNLYSSIKSFFLLEQPLKTSKVCL